MSNLLALSIEQVQEISGLGRTKIYELLKSGSLPAKKIGKRTLVLASDLETFLSGLESYATQNGGTGHA